MPFYQRRGDVPRKRHIVFRENGRLLTEEVMGLEGFSGNESILYHLESPCRVKELGAFTPLEREEWVPETHAHRLVNTYDVAPEGDEISGRRTLMWNDDVEISLCCPASSMEYFFRNGEGDEVVFVHEGTGTLETIFGDVPYRDGDYVVIPRGTTYRFVPEGPQRYLVFETPGLIEIPKRYRNEYGQIMEGAPYDLFASANEAFVDDVIRSDACSSDSKAVYAQGRIALWSAKSSQIEPPRSLADLADARFQKIAIANPEHAPYGAAAKDALIRAGVWEKVQPKLVFGENIQQTMQFAQSGNADAAIVALSLAIVSESPYTLIDAAEHRPLIQVLVACGGGPQLEGGRAFAAFVGSDPGRQIMRRYGFFLPGEATAAAR